MYTVQDELVSAWNPPVGPYGLPPLRVVPSPQLIVQPTS